MRHAPSFLSERETPWAQACAFSSLATIELHTIQDQQTRPTVRLAIVVRRDDRRPAEQLRLLMRHIQEQQGRELFEAILIGEPIVSQDGAAIPELLNDAMLVILEAPFAFLMAIIDS